MHALSTAELEKVLVLINSGHSAHQISSLTGHHTSTITCIWSKHCPHVPKSSGGCPSKLSPTDMHHAIHLINSGKAENATHVARSLQSITNQSLSHETICTHLKKAGLKAVVKKKSPLLSQHHKHEWMDFALSHRHWTGRGWCGLMRPRLTSWALMGKNGYGKVLGRLSLTAWWKGPRSLVVVHL